VKDGYACGWFVETRFNRKLITHGGDINGFRADMQRFVDEDLTVIALLNFDSTFTRNVFRSLGGIALGEPVQPALRPEGIPIAPQALAELAGTYRFDAQNTLTLSVKEGQLRVDATGMPSASGIPQTEKWFFIPSWNGMLGIQRGQDGKVASAVLIQGSQTLPAKRVP
jgi:hypothetical protein